MEIVERYLQAVKFWLPRRQKDDIIAELSEDIRAQIEDGESALGRKFTSGEVEELLKQRGRPVSVANRYLPQEYLIGPVLFHVYRFVLKIVALCYLVPWLLVSVCLFFYSPAYSGQSWLGAFGGSFWTTAFVAMATVTLVFAILERVEAKSHFLEAWNPRSLPAVRHPNLIARSTSSFELAVNVVILVWWLASLYSTTIVIQSSIRILLAPIWPWYFWGFSIVTLANCDIAAANLVHPYLTLRKAVLRLVVDAAGSALLRPFPALSNS